MAGDVTQVVVFLPSKGKALSSNPVVQKTKNKTKQDKKTLKPSKHIHVF
jgi:hypothetical protein